MQLVVDGLEEGRGLKDEQWQTARDKVAEEVGWLVCGFEGDKASKIAEQVSAYLDQKHSGQAKPGNREAEIRKLIGKPGPVVLLKNVMEHNLAELLSNPRVEQATKDCLRQIGRTHLATIQRRPWQSRHRQRGPILRMRRRTMPSDRGPRRPSWPRRQRSASSSTMCSRPPTASRGRRSDSTTSR